MARYGRLLTDAQWEKIRPLLPKRRKSRSGGRPPANDRKVLEGILWILRSGARWQDLPEEFPSERGIYLTIWRAFLAELNQRKQLQWSESFLDGSFAPAKKGLENRKNQAGQGHEVDGGGRRLGYSSGRATLLCVPNEVRLAEETLASIRVTRRHRCGRPRQKPERVIADRAYDSDPLRERLAARGIHLIAPHRDAAGKRAATLHEQISVVIDGRSLVEALYQTPRLLHDLIIRHPQV